MAVIFRQNQVYQFIGYLKDEDSNFSTFDKEFLQIIKSLRPLRKDEVKLTQPLRISTYKVKKTDTYESLAMKSSINTNAEDQLRLINGDYPDKPLIEGRVIKIVE
jgi:predicted Zn-dependent protease